MAIARKVMKLFVGVALALATPSVFAVPNTTFGFVCTDPIDCDGDTALSLTITLADSVINAGGVYDTSSDGGAGFLGWSMSSDVWGGSLVSGVFSDIYGIDSGFLRLAFDATGILTSICDGVCNDQVLEAVVFTEDLLFLPGTRWLEIREPNVIDDRASVGGSFDPTDIAGTFRQVPEPATLALFGLGLAGIGAARRNRHAA